MSRLTAAQRESLALAIESKTEAQAAYQGVAGKAIVERLRRAG